MTEEGLAGLIVVGEAGPRTPEEAAEWAAHEASVAAMVERLQLDHLSRETLYMCYHDARTAYDDALADNARLRTALERYANPDNWHWVARYGDVPTHAYDGAFRDGSPEGGYLDAQEALKKAVCGDNCGEALEPSSD